jgi:hypothetical protein
MVRKRALPRFVHPRRHAELVSASMFVKDGARDEMDPEKSSG